MVSGMGGRGEWGGGTGCDGSKVRSWWSLDSVWRTLRIVCCREMMVFVSSWEMSFGFWTAMLRGRVRMGNVSRAQKAGVMRDVLEI